MLNSPLSRPAESHSLDVDDHFALYQRLTVRQRIRWWEVFTSFELRNTYDVYDERGEASLRVQEQGHGFWRFVRRFFLGPARPFLVHVTDTKTGRLLLALQRRFRFFFHRLEVRRSDGRVLGAVQKKWSLLRRIYHLESESGHVVAELFGPIFKPWTFEIRFQDRVVGVIQKKWSGFGKEMFTDADNFGAELSNIRDARLKLLAFSAIVLIDVVHFEKSKG